MLEDGRSHRERTGQSLMVPRGDIVPIPEHLRGNLAERSIQMFPAETAQSMFDFRADEVVAKIAPRPLLLLHSSSDSVTPTEQSVELFRRARQPCDLHLFSEIDHFMFAENNIRVRRVLLDWLEAAAGRMQVVSTTPATLLPHVQAGAFIEQLYYRLNTVCVDMSA